MVVPNSMGCRTAKASPHLLGARCRSPAARCHSRRRVRPTGVGRVCCAVACRRVVRGGSPGQGRLPRGRRGFWPLPKPLVGRPSSEPLVRCGGPRGAVLSPHQRVAGEGLAPRVLGCVSSHIGHSAPPVPGGSFGRYGALPLPATGRPGQDTRVPSWAGRGGPDRAASRVRRAVFLVSARGGLGPWGVFHTPHEGAAEGTEDLVHKNCV